MPTVGLPSIKAKQEQERDIRPAILKTLRQPLQKSKPNLRKTLMNRCWRPRLKMKTKKTVRRTHWHQRRQKMRYLLLE